MPSRKELVRDLRELGLPEGAIVIVHGSLSSLGDVAGGAETVVDALLEAVGPQGTVMVPTFATATRMFVPESSPTGLGAVAEALRRRRGAVRSLSPLASVAALGPHAEDICKGHDASETAHAEGTPYLRIAERDGYVLLLGVDQDRNTTLHTAEELVRAPYLRPATGQVMKKSAARTVTYQHFPGPHRNFIGIDKALREQGVVKVGRVGECVARLMRAKELVDATVAMLRHDPAAVLCDNPACDDCVGQRAAIRRHRLGQEQFTLAARSQLAGRYPAEIADQFARAGLAHIEVDLVQGRDIVHVADDVVSDLAGELFRVKLTVSSVRLRAAPANLDAAIDRIKTLNAGMVVLPSSADRTAVERVREAGMTPALENVAMGREELGARLEELDSFDARCAFNPAGFVRVGEKPFLEAYKRPVRRHVGLLYVGDARFDGGAARLARGNAEIKEMVSILRAGGFRGPMVLTGEPGELEARVADFMNLLESL